MYFYLLCSNFLQGSAKVLNSNLHLGPQLRELNESFVESLIEQMKPFPGHFYQPLCVIIDARDVTCFRENNVSIQFSDVFLRSLQATFFFKLFGDISVLD